VSRVRLSGPLASFADDFATWRGGLEYNRQSGRDSICRELTDDALGPAMILTVVPYDEVL